MSRLQGFIGTGVLALALIAAAWLWLRPASPAPRANDDRLVIAMASDAATLDPHMTAAVGGDLSILSHIYPSLIVRRPDLSLQPGVAASWDAVSPTRWRFHLVSDARFANGERLDADAVKWNLERVLDPATQARIRLWFEPVSAVTAVDRLTLDIETREPFLSLPAQLSMLFLLPPDWSRTHDPARETLSGGPYELVENAPGERLTLRRNPKYWGPTPAFETVEFRTIPSATARVAALLAGEVDLIINIPLAEVARIQTGGKAVAGSIPSIRSVFIKLNTLKPPLDDVRVRQALNLAIDKQALSDALFDGQAMVSPCQLLTPAYPGFNPALKPTPYDPDRARALLREAGVGPGTRLEFEVPVNYTLQGEEVAQVVAGQLQAVGLDVRLTQMDSSFYMDKFIKGRALGALSLLTHAWPTIDADGLLSLLHSQSPYAYYDDPTLDRLLVAGRTTLDPTARAEVYRQATAHLCEQAPVLFLYAQPYTYATSSRIRWAARGDDWLRAMDVSRATPGS